jgi:hypothetical protein
MKTWQLLKNTALLLTLSIAIADPAKADSPDNNQTNTESTVEGADTIGTVKKVSDPLVTIETEDGQTKTIYVSKAYMEQWRLTKGMKVALVNNRIIGAGDNMAESASSSQSSGFVSRTSAIMEELKASRESRESVSLSQTPATQPEPIPETTPAPIPTPEPSLAPAPTPEPVPQEEASPVRALW